MHGEALDAVLDAGSLEVLKVSEDDLSEDGWDMGSERRRSPPPASWPTTGAAAVVISRGADPAVAFAEGRVLRIEPPPLTEVDHAGAGDSMTAGIAVGRMRGLSTIDAIKLGAAAGAGNAIRHGLGSGSREPDRRADRTRRDGGRVMSDVPVAPGPSPEVDHRIVVDHQPVDARETIRVLVTNDDGIDAPGIAHLAHALADEFDVTVAAPAKDSSGMGTGIGRFDPQAGIPLRRVDIGLPRGLRDRRPARAGGDGGRARCLR